MKKTGEEKEGIVIRDGNVKEFSIQQMIRRNFDFLRQLREAVIIFMGKKSGMVLKGTAW